METIVFPFLQFTIFFSNLQSLHSIPYSITLFLEGTSIFVLIYNKPAFRTYTK